MRMAILILTIFNVAVAGAQSVKVVSDPSLDTASYSTFRIDKGDFITLTDGKGDADKFYAIMKDGIRSELERKGYKFTEDSIANLVVSYLGESIQKMDTENLGPLGQTPAADGTQVDGSRNWSREYSQNTLVIEVTDQLRKKTIWKANSSFEGTALTDLRTVNMVIYRSLKKFPTTYKKKKRK